MCFSSTPLCCAFVRTTSLVFLLAALGSNYAQSPVLNYGITPYDITNAVYASGEDLNVGSLDGFPTDFHFSPDGMWLFFIGATNDRVYRYSLATPFDVSTATSSGSYDFSSRETGPTGLSFSPDGLRMFIVGNNGDAVLEFSLFSAFNLGLVDYIRQFDITAQELHPTGVEFSADGLKMFVSGIEPVSFGGSIHGIIHEYNLSTPFRLNSVTLAAGQELDVNTQDRNPFGFTFSADGMSLFIAGNQDNAVIEYQLTAPYDISTGSYNAQFSVGESVPHDVAFNDTGGRMYVIGLSRRVREYNLGTVPDNYPELPINDGSLDNTDPIVITLTDETFAPSDSSDLASLGHVTVGNVPSGLIPIVIVGDGRSTATLTFTGRAINHNDSDDVSDLTFSFSDSAFTGGDAANVIGSGSATPHSSNVGVDFSPNPELSYGNSGTDYPETSANDGSIDNSNPMVITLSDDTFTAADGADMVALGHVTVGNVPAGLTPIVTVGGGLTTATLTFTGKAINHNDSDDVSDLTFVFSDSAFSGGDAANVIGSGSFTPHLPNVGIDFTINPVKSYMRHGKHFQSGERKVMEFGRG